MALQHLRSSTANKRPTPAAMSDGQVAINSNTASPGLFFKDSAGALIKVGPVHVGTTAPNASPASGGETGNTVGEQWLDTTGGTYVFKVWDGSAWRSETGTFVDVNGDTMTGALGIIAGSAGSPGLYFSGDTNTGIYSPGADQVAVATSGAGRLFIDSSGNVGVGTATTNWSLLDGLIVQTGNGYAGINIASSSATDNAYLAFGYGTTAAEQFSASIGRVGNNTLVLGTNNTERLRITSAGFVGVGTSSADTLLHLALTSSPGNKFRAQGANNTDFRIGDHALSNGGFYINSQAANQDLRLQTQGTDRVTINSTGLGIGTTSPASNLDIQGSNTRFRIDTSAASTDVEILARDTGNNTLKDLSIYASAHKFLGANVERARIDSGRLLIGTSADSGGALLQVNGDRIRVGTAKTPASATDTGTAGEICWDTSYLYVCTASNTWKRAALSTW